MKHVVPGKTTYMRGKKGLMPHPKALIRSLDPANRMLRVDAWKHRGVLGRMALDGTTARHGSGLR